MEKGDSEIKGEKAKELAHVQLHWTPAQPGHTF